MIDAGLFFWLHVLTVIALITLVAGGGVTGSKAHVKRPLLPLDADQCTEFKTVYSVD